jgi:flagellar biosynthesis component FlhA
MVAPQDRPYVRELTRDLFPELAVLSPYEIPEKLTVNVLGKVTMEA